jgi:hypothetical protein
LPQCKMGEVIDTKYAIHFQRSPVASGMEQASLRHLDNPSAEIRNAAMWAVLGRAQELKRAVADAAHRHGDEAMLANLQEYQAIEASRGLSRLVFVIVGLTVGVIIGGMI